MKIDLINTQKLNLITDFQGQAKMAKLENQPQIQSLGSKLNMFDLESLLYFDSTWKHTLCTIKFILTEFYLFKQILLHKFTKNLNW